jgi:hypothetical protein
MKFHCVYILLGACMSPMASGGATWDSVSSYKMTTQTLPTCGGGRYPCVAPGIGAVVRNRYQWWRIERALLASKYSTGGRWSERRKDRANRYLRRRGIENTEVYRYTSTPYRYTPSPASHTPILTSHTPKQRWHKGQPVTSSYRNDDPRHLMLHGSNHTAPTVQSNAKIPLERLASISQSPSSDTRDQAKNSGGSIHSAAPNTGGVVKQHSTGSDTDMDFD